MGVMRLRLFGGVAWEYGDRVTPIVGGRRLGVLLLLTERQGSTVSVDEILDRLWSKPPASGSNAVQRHISALRKDLRSAGHDEPNNIVESLPGGYRLSTGVATDLTLIEECLDNDLAVDSLTFNWWEAPILGAADEPHATLRHQLEVAAGRLFERWIRFENPSAELVTGRHSALATHAQVSVDVRAPLRSTTRTVPRTVSAEALRRVFGLWAVGRGSEALDLVDDRSEDFDPDLRRRLIRWLVWLSPTDCYATAVATSLPRALAATPVQAERTIAALDGYALLFDDDAETTLERERSHAASVNENVRCLRVEYLYRLARPADDKHDLRIVDELAACGHPDGQVESARFRFVNALRRGRLTEIGRLLEWYEEAVATHWPWQGDDYGELTRAILRRAADSEARALFGTAEPRIDGYSSDGLALEIADIISRLVSPDRDRLPTPPEIAAIRCLSPPEAAALELMEHLAHERPVAEAAHAMADRLPQTTRDKTFSMNLVSLTLAAERLGDTELAERVAIAMAPWSGQALGTWPSSFYFGLTDRWLDRLAAI